MVFGNVRDAGWLTEDHFRARPGSWRFVIDYPFDEAGHSAAEDLARVDRLAEGGLKSRTIVWLPRFLSEDRMREVRRLVILDWLLSGTGERWAGTPTTCPRWTGAGQGDPGEPAHRAAGGDAPRGAGLLRRRGPSPAPWPRTPRTTGCSSAWTPSFSPAAPVGADLAAAFGNLVDQAFTATYQGHPRFEPGDTEVTVRDLAAVYAHVERAVADPERRVRLEGDIAAVRRVANALQVGSRRALRRDRFRGAERAARRCPARGVGVGGVGEVGGGGGW